MVSIIVIDYKKENPLLKQCLEEIGKQTYKDYEIILLTDYKNDLKFPRLRKYSYGKYLEPAKKRDNGAKMAKGDIVPFVPDSVFSFEEIHEGGDILLDFLKREFPHKKDLALAMMAHSVKYGADKFNKEVDQWLLGNDQGRKAQIVSKISACSRVSFEVAMKSRLHNYLWAGLDVYLLDNKKDFVESFFQNVPLVDIREIADILARCFRKNPKRVLVDVQKCLSPVQKLEPNPDSLVRWWQRTAKDLPEGDRIDIDKTTSLFLEIEKEFLPEWESVLQRVIGANRTGV